MRYGLLFRLRTCVLLNFLLVVATQGFSKLPAFEPLSAEELALEAPRVDAEADVELLFRSVKVNDRSFGITRRWESYHRLKVFTRKGVDQLGVFNLEFEKGESRISDFKARVTHPDGSVFELSKKDLYRNARFEDGDDSRNVMSFAVPHLQVGSIVEYAWSESVDDGVFYPLSMFLEMRWPTWKYRIEIVPSRMYPSTMRGLNCDVAFEKTSDSTYLIVGENIPAWRSEPYAPPGLDYRAWVFMLYVLDADIFDNQTFWDKEADELWSQTKRFVKPKQGAVRKLAAELFAGTKDGEEMLRRAYRYCAEEITNVNSAQAGFTSEEREKLKDVDSPAETIKRGYGSGLDVNRLFASLAAAAGYEVLLARVNDSSEMMFVPSIMNVRLAFPEEVVAVREKESDLWRYFDPGYSYLPFETLIAGCVNAPALIANPKKAKLGMTPPAPPEFSAIRRWADLELDASGDLSGTVTVSYSGYMGIRRKRFYDERSESEREEAYTKRLVEKLAGCRITDFKMENVFSRDEPLVVSYTIHAPAYAERLGKRLFVQPNFFQYGEDPLFTAEERKQQIVFPFLWEETDEITLTFPDGFKPEEASSPGNGYDANYIYYKSVYGLNDAKNKLRCLRDFRIKGNGFLPKGYAILKKLFESVNQQDTHVLTLVRSEGSELYDSI
ncbi:DUF3857 domain-containing protein [Pelagicoccus sp. SDUM812003]|uniref:DUF3857 domain-containing protein n=1 Tax=Pelagicoccus sp. SDUM812003 TaxID=3041267 RepID=UPI00280D4D10|nr:DUF3857 domain-containing protein [Pelagicoccus sp. SDUM812003]MDQ8202362.1 DUF3857 domain-containing protein [Pelagicoccus sp. SDUM812003]